MARKLAWGIFAEYKCGKYEITDEGLMGTFPNSDKVLLERSVIEQHVLSCITDLVMRELPSELNELITHHDQSIRERALQRERDRVSVEIEKINQKRCDAWMRRDEQGAVVRGIKSAIDRLRVTIENTKRNIDVCKSRKEDIAGMLRPFDEKTELEKIELYGKQLLQMESDLLIEQQILSDAEIELGTIPDNPDAESVKRLLGL